MPRLIEADYTQVQLLPPSLEDWVGPDHPARFIREFVRTLDLNALGFKQPAESLFGRPGFAPELMLRVWLYGYLEKVRSHRQLERACQERMGFIWLCGNQAPDHNSLWRFWNANREPIKKVFKQTVKVALKLELIGLVLQALDGTKIQAACSGRGVYDREALEKALGKMEEILAEREKELEKSGLKESAQEPSTRERYDKLSVEELRAALAQVEAGESRHVHPQEPQARRMGCDGRNRFGYNAQAVVDAQSQVIVAAEVVASPVDVGQINPMIKLAEETLREAGAPADAKPTTLLDGGYASGRELKEAQEAGREVLSPLPSGSKNPQEDPFHASCFEFDAERDVVRCPQGRELPFRRLRARSGGVVREYRSAAICQGCPMRERCTGDRHGRSIEIAPWHQAMREHRLKMERSENAELYKRRSTIVEPVFGWVKARMEFRRWTVRGLEKVGTQWALVCSALNLRKIYGAWVKKPNCLEKLIAAA